MLVVLQFGLFRLFVQSQIAWRYPQTFDQAVYLLKSYETYDSMKRDGALAGLWVGAGFNGGTRLPTGALMHLQSALLFEVLGPSRLAALTLNFIYFVILQAVLLYTIHFWSQSWLSAFAGLGLLLSARTTFQLIGGIADCRMDFIAFCLFAIFLCVVVRSNMFESGGWSIVASLVAAYTVAFRFMTLAYFLPIFIAALTIVLISRHLSRNQAVTERPSRRVRNLSAVGILAGLLLLPVMFHHYSALRAYYVGSHLALGATRAELTGTTGRLAALVYYPRSIIQGHAGTVFWVLGLLLIAAARFCPRREIALRRMNVTLLITFMAACLCLPLIVLNLDSDKNAAVGGVLVGPLLLAIVILMLSFKPPGKAAVNSWWPAVSATSVVVGLAVQAFGYTRHSAFAGHEADVRNILGLYDSMDHIAQARGGSGVAVANTAMVDFLFPPAVDVVSYERRGHFIHCHELLATDISAKSDGQIDEAMKQCDVLILSTRIEPTRRLSPLVRSLIHSNDRVQRYCDSNLQPLAPFDAMGWHVRPFIRTELTANNKE
jgi:hypothetical protein